MNYLIAVYVSLSSMLIGCSNEPTQSTDVAEAVYSVKLILYDFYDQDVILSINGVEIINKHLNVGESNATTGLNVVKTQELKRKNVFRLHAKGLDIETTIIVNPNTRLIYINPSVKPYIMASESDTITLD